MKHEIPIGFTALAADVGGTNTSLALVRSEPEGLKTLSRRRYGTASLGSFEEALEDALPRFKKEFPDAQPAAGCVSAAGPVKSGRVQLTNALWAIDQQAVSESARIPVRIVNDFSALCYGVALFEGRDDGPFVRLPHPDGSLPEPSGPVRLVVGAGTGIGVGYLVDHGSEPRAYPSEGGHSDIGEVDEETVRLRAFVREHISPMPGAELFVSGQGIEHIYRFLTHERRGPQGAVARELEAATPSERPALIAGHAKRDAACAHVLELFVRLYGKFAGSAALSFLPYGGLYLAGGITAKNIAWFSENHRFTNAFRANYNPSMQTPLSQIPISAVTDYGLSLYGCTFAAYLWLNRERL